MLANSQHLLALSLDRLPACLFEPQTQSAFDFSLNVLTIGKDLAIDSKLKEFLNFRDLNNFLIKLLLPLLPFRSLNCCLLLKSSYRVRWRETRLCVHKTYYNGILRAKISMGQPIECANLGIDITQSIQAITNRSDGANA